MLITSVLRFLEGNVTLYAEECEKERFVSVLSRLGISVKITDDAKNGGVFAQMRPSAAKKIAPALDKSGIIVYINNIFGIKNLLCSNVKRPGLLIGGILFFFLLIASTFFVFKVDVSGSDLIPKEQIKSELADFGIRAGARISDIDRADVSGRFLLAHPEFSWAALNVNGTTVCLELKEKNTSSPANGEKYDFLVADSDAVIRYLSIKSGKGMVTSGTSVKKGDILIIGYISGNGLQYSDDPTLRYDGASGIVYAEVSESLSVFVPYEESVTVRNTSSRTGIRLSVFGHYIVFGDVSDGDGYQSSAERNFTVWGAIELPITYSECYASEIKTVKVIRDETQAVAEAERRAYSELVARLGEAELTQTKLIKEITDGGVTVTVTYGCVRNIAVPMDIKK